MAAAIALAGASLFLTVWTVSCEPSAHVTPACEKKDISGIVEKEELEEADYRILYLQTGLGRPVIDLLRSQGRQQEINVIQDLYFREVRVKCEPNTVISREEHIVDENGLAADGMLITDVEEGDILITFCSHTFGWRNGHAALVVDAENRLILEAQVLGSPSVIASLNRFASYPSFVILRLTEADRETRRNIALYAKEQLTGVPYRLEAGIREALCGGREDASHGGGTIDAAAKDGTRPAGTQCSHLVWYAFDQFGYDLDSDGGIIVTPRDIADSPLLEVIQIYGMSL